jgi:hypothetical protein
VGLDDEVLSGALAAGVETAVSVVERFKYRAVRIATASTAAIIRKGRKRFIVRKVKSVSAHPKL